MKFTGAQADHVVLLDRHVASRPVNDDSALLIIPYEVALDIAFRGTAKYEVDGIAMLRPVERLLADIRYGRIQDIDIGAVVDDAVIIGAVDVGLAHSAVAGGIIDTDIAAGRVDVAGHRAGRVDHRRRQIDGVPYEASRRTTGRLRDRRQHRPTARGIEKPPIATAIPIRPYRGFAVKLHPSDDKGMTWQ
jgi:hypothetical protein